MFPSARKDTFTSVSYKKMSTEPLPYVHHNYGEKTKNNYYSNFIKFILVFSFCAFAIMSVVIFLAYFKYFTTKMNSTVPFKEIPEALQCSIDENRRFDCWPEINEATEEKCQKRGCCWKASSKPGTAPYCFFPTNYVGYNVSEVNETSYGMEAKLIRNSKSFFSPDVETLQLKIDYMSDSILRLKVIKF